MIDNKRFTKISLFAIIIVIGIAFLSFYIGDKTEQMITGKVVAQAYIFQLPPANCSVDLHAGLNLVSFYCELGIKPINETLVNASNYTLDYGAIYAYNPSNPNNSWATINPTLPNWTEQELSTIGRYKGYWILMNSPGNYSKEGSKFTNTNIGLEPGWNLIGYPTDIQVNITTGFSSISGFYTRVESYQRINGTDTWLNYTPGIGGSLEFLEPMKAYWINVSNSTTWPVTW